MQEDLEKLEKGKPSLTTEEEKNKAIPKKYDDPIKQEYYERVVKHNQFIDSKRQADYKYYGEKLTKMCEDTISVITTETTPEELANYLKIGNKEYLDMIAKARQTRKYLKLNINAYMQCMVDGLQRRMILTDKKTVDVVNVTDEDIAKEISLQEQSILVSEKIETGIPVIDEKLDIGFTVEQNSIPLEQNEEDKINDISQDVVENNSVEENGESK